MTITRTLATGLIGLAASGLFTAGSAVALATLNASPVALHCHTLEGCTEGELHHADHRAQDHARHEEHRLERGHVL